MKREEAVECLGLTKLDYIIIDNKHDRFETESTRNFIRVVDVRGMTLFVRLKDMTRLSTLKALDIGLGDLLFRRSRPVEEVKKMVEYVKYHPVGGFTGTKSSILEYKH